MALEYVIPFLTFAFTIYNTNLARGLLCIRWTLALFAEPNEPPFNLIVREGDGEGEREDQDKVDGDAGEVLRLHVDVEGDSGVVPAQLLRFLALCRESYLTVAIEFL